MERTRGKKTGGSCRTRTFTGLLLALALSAVVSAFLAVLVGSYPIPAAETVSILKSAVGLTGTSQIDEARRLVIVDIRLSRIILSWLVGVALASAGVVYQCVLRNPLADPFTLGVSTGAAFGASVVIYGGLTGISAGLAGINLLPASALTGALLALAAVLALSRVRGFIRRETLVLAGIAVATFLSALISLIKSLDEESVSNIVFWIMGGFQGRGWSHVLLFLPYLLAGLLVIWRYSREMDILSLGDIQARQLGVNVGRVRVMLLVGASLAASAAVAVSGVIGFVGLVVPHLVRLLQGAEHRPLLITSGLAGGLLLLWSDLAARTILPNGAELPVGVVTALLGGPFFCILLRKKSRKEMQ